MHSPRTKGKLLIFAAPSGAGKTTIVRHLAKVFPSLAFSVSATTRQRRPHETDGHDYYFLTQEAFQERIAQGGFVEWEEVYPGQFYGTLAAEIERLSSPDADGEAHDIIFDIDVRGALNIKRHYPDRALTVFVKPPSRETLHQRLRQRNTETEESLQKRLAKADVELAYENKFDRVLVNDILPQALSEAENIVSAFIGKPVQQAPPD